MFRTATTKMATEDVIAALAKTKLTAAEQAQILAERGLSSTRATMIATANALSNTDLYAALTKNQLTMETIAQSGALNGLTTAQIMAATAAANLTAKDLAQILATTTLTADQQIEILTKKGLAKAEAEAMVAKAAHTVATSAATASTGLLTSATFTLTSILKGLWATLMANPLIAIAAAIAAVTAAISFAKRKAEELKQKANEVTSTYKQQTESLKNTKEKLDDLSDRYEKLSKGVDAHNKNVSLSNDEYSEYIDICNQLGDMFPSLIQGFDNQGNVILRCKDNVEELTKAYEEEVKAANGAVIAQGENVFKSFKKEAKDFVISKGIEGNHSNLTLSGINLLKELLNSSDLDEAVEQQVRLGTPTAVEIITALNNAGIERPETDWENDNGIAYIKHAIRENRVVVESIVADWNKQVDEQTQGVKSIASGFIYNSLLDEKFDGLSAQDKAYIQKYVDDFSVDFLYKFKNAQGLYSYLNKWLDDFVNNKAPLSNPEALANSETVINETKKQAEALKSAFSEIFSSSDKDSAFKTSVDTYIDKVTELKSALEKLRKEELDSKDKTKLFEDFPALAYQADNLDAAIVNLISDLKADIGDDVSQQLKNMATDEDRAALEAYGIELSNLASIADYASIRVEHLTSTIDKVEKGKSVLKSATDEMRENGEISQNTLKSIMELVDEGENWVDYIKLENGQLKLNVDLWQDKIKDSLKLELTNFENELAILRKENDEIVKQIALFKTRKSFLAQETVLTDQNKKLFMPSLVGSKRDGFLTSNINQDMLWSPYDARLEEGRNAEKELKEQIDVIKALMDSYDKEFESIISGTDSDSKSSKSSDPKQYNWIETVIDRIKRKINSFANTVSSKFKTFSQRNNAAKEEISAITKEIELQQKAYEKYIKLADSVKLSESIKEKVRNGAIDISEYSEENAELIDKYKEWYEASLNAKDAIDELHESLASLYDDEFSRIETEFKNRISLISYLSNMYNTGMDTLEAKGYIASTEFYKALSNVSERNINVLKDELSSLETAMQSALNSGEIEQYSEAWLNYQPHYLATSKHNNLFNCWNTLRAMRTTA